MITYLINMFFLILDPSKLIDLCFFDCFRYIRNVWFLITVICSLSTHLLMEWVNFFSIFHIDAWNFKFLHLTEDLREFLLLVGYTFNGLPGIFLWWTPNVLCTHVKGPHVDFLALRNLDEVERITLLGFH